MHEHDIAPVTAKHHGANFHVTHDGHGGHDKHAGHDPEMFRRRFWVSLLLTIPLVVTSEMVMDWFGYELDFAGMSWLGPLLGSIVFWWGGWPFLAGGVAELRDRQPGMMLLISMAITVAYAASMATSFDWLDLEFWWELAALVTIMLLGHWQEMKAIGQARGALAALGGSSTTCRSMTAPRPTHEAQGRGFRRVRRQGHPGPRGARPGPQAARACTSVRPVWPACTTSSGRSSTTPSTRRWPATARASSSRCRPTAAAASTTTAAASRSTRTRRVRTRARARPRSCSPCCTPAASSAAAATRCRAACTASASASSTRCPSACCSRSTATASATARSSPRAASRRARSRSSATRPTRGRKTGTTVTFWPDPTIFAAEGTEFVARTVLERLQTMAFLNRGLEIVFTDERAEKRAAGHLPVQGRPGRLRQAPQRLQGGAVLQGLPLRGRATRSDQMLDIAIQWNTGYYEGIHGYANGISTIEGGMHVEGFRTALTTVRQQVRPRQGPAQGEGRQPARRGHPRGHHGDRLGEAARSAVRGPDQGQARQRPDALVRPEGHQRAPRRVARGEPDRGQQGRQEGARPRRRPASRRRTPATPSAARRRCRAPACPTS